MSASRSNGSVAKIARPKISGVFRRNRLFSLLDGHLNFPAVWISAPAGSGKTTLIASYLAERNIPSIWYQMDEEDADIATFFYYMGKGAAKAAPRKRPLPFLTPEYLQGVSAFTAGYFDNLYSRLKRPFMIVFDNYQLVPQKSPLHHVMYTGLDRLPEGINIICLSREEPPEQFARLRANEMLKIMDPEDIRFTFKESREMMRIKDLNGLSEETAHHLHEKTRGWAAGLVLMMERVRLTGDHTVMPADLTVKEVFEYFSQEVFEKINPVMREFLLKTAFMSRMTAKMAKELTGIAHSGNILALLYQRNFFIYRDIQQQPFYQYHPLFKEFLRSRINELMTKEQARMILMDSARMLEETGQVEAAVGLLIDAGDWSKLTSLVLIYAQGLVRQGRSDTVEKWLRAFPKTFFDKVPWLLYWMGVCRIHKDPMEGLACFEKAFRIFEKRNEQAGTLLAWSGAVDSLLFTWDDYRAIDQWVEWLDTRISQGLAFPSAEIEAHVASSMAGALVWRLTCRPDVREWLDRAGRLSQDTGDESLSFQTLFQLGTFYYFIGDFVSLKDLAQRMAEETRGSRTSPLYLIFIRVGLSYSLAALSSENVRSVQYVREGLELADRLGVHLFDNLLHSIGSYAAYNMKDFKLADECLEKLAHDLEGGLSGNMGRYYIRYGWRRFLEGDLDGAQAAVDRGFQLAEASGVVCHRQQCHHFQAVVLQHMNRCEEALGHVIAAKGMCPVSGEGYYYDYIFLLIEAEICLTMGLKERGVDCLRKAMTIGRKQGYKSLFLFWRPVAMAGLCTAALGHGIEVEYVKDLIQTLNLPVTV